MRFVGVVVVVVCCLCVVCKAADLRLVGVADGVGVRMRDVCTGHRCDSGACPCGCECGDRDDPGLCYVPKASGGPNGRKRIARWENSTTAGRAAAGTGLSSSAAAAATDTAATATPNGVVEIDADTGTVRVLHRLAADVAIFGSAYDPLEGIIYLWWSVMGQILPFALGNETMLTPIDVDMSRCEGGTGCFNELQWDTQRQILVAVAIGFGGPQNAVVSIDPSTGAVAQLSPAFSRDCALYLQCSTYDSASSTFFAWLACSSTPTAQLFGISTLSGASNKGNTTLLSVSMRDVLGPMAFDPAQNAPVGVGPDGKLYLAQGNNATKLLSKLALGGIPADGGLVVVTRGVPRVYASVVDLSKNKLARVDLSNDAVSTLQLPYTIGQLYFYDTPTPLQ